MNDSLPVQAIPVTDTPDAVTAAVAALIEHDATCGYCATASPGDPRCMERAELAAAWRRALREAPAGGRITTTPAAG